MESNDGIQLQYEKQVLYLLLIFRKAMDQYGQWWDKAFHSTRLSHDPQFTSGMAQLIKVMKTCGARFQEIPAPPDGLKEADLSLRGMGKELESFAGSLQTVTRLTNLRARKRRSQILSTQVTAIKQGYHQFVSTYEQVYPGRLSNALESFRENTKSKPNSEGL